MPQSCLHGNRTPIVQDGAPTGFEARWADRQLSSTGVNKGFLHSGVQVSEQEYHRNNEPHTVKYPMSRGEGGQGH